MNHIVIDMLYLVAVGDNVFTSINSMDIVIVVVKILNKK